MICSFFFKRTYLGYPSKDDKVRRELLVEGQEGPTVRLNRKRSWRRRRLLRTRSRRFCCRNFNVKNDVVWRNSWNFIGYDPDIFCCNCECLKVYRIWTLVYLFHHIPKKNGIMRCITHSVCSLWSFTSLSLMSLYSLSLIQQSFCPWRAHALYHCATRATHTQVTLRYLGTHLFLRHPVLKSRKVFKYRNCQNMLVVFLEWILDVEHIGPILKNLYHVSCLW